MNDIVIRAENLGKKYNIKSVNPFQETLRDTISNRLTQLLRSNHKNSHDTSFWALKDFSFEVRKGEVIGIIGRNGAGKTTLLKLLSRITEPTEGFAEIRGRVGSLLEVGTGFHPELSGRENIFLSAAILGMGKQEILAKLNNIITFAEIDQFIDTPVKHYSSGMYVRLAFAVAAHLDPEILFVDEVLAVGDVAFQKKCLGKMTEVASEGRTILFVSHNLTAIQNLCSVACVLDGGKKIFHGSVAEAIQLYLGNQSELSSVDVRHRTDRSGNGTIRITSISVNAADKNSIQSGDPLHVKVTYESKGSSKNVRFLVGIYDLMNVPMFRLDSQTAPEFSGEIKGNGTVVCSTGPFNVTPGPCLLNVAVYSGSELADHVVHALRFIVEPVDFYKSGRLFDRNDSLFLLPQKWYNDEA
jgi:lipopolysaccharide transport system ATP-binding protein